MNLGEVEFGAGWQSAVMRFAGDAKEMNTDRSARAHPRHQKATDPLALEAIANDGAHERIRKQWTFVHTVPDAGWLRFNQVPLGDGYRRFRVVYGNDRPEPRRLEVRLDSVDGPVVGKVDLPQTDTPRGGRIQVYQTATGEVSPTATGTHDVFVLFRGEGDKPVGEFEYFRFEQYRGQIALQRNEVKVEVRVDAKDGPKIGEFYPRPTGGADNYRLLVATLEPVAGRHPLFLVVRSAVAGPIGTVDWVSLEKAKQPIDWTGVGIPPRRDARGKMVLPAATHRPCARPADKYDTARAGSDSQPRPLFAARRLSGPPTVDGRLDEWPVEDPKQTMRLGETPFRAPAAAPAGTAWVGYDDEALYVAVRTPMAGPPRGKKPHTWGADDGMEIAFQDAFGAKPGQILNLYGYPDGAFESVETGGASAAAVARLGKAVTYRAVVGPEEWSCEWRIPFAATGFTPKTAPLLLFNMGVRQVAKDAWLIWRGTEGATHVVGKAGVLLFPGEAAAMQPPAEKMEVWLDAAGTVEKDAAGRVAVWKDRGGKGRDARQDAPDFRPLYVADGLNGKPALRFDEKRSTRLELPDLAEKKIPATIFAVFSNPEPPSEVNHHARIFTTSDGKAFDYQVGLACHIDNVETGGPRQTVARFPDRWAKKVHVGCFSPNYQTFFTGAVAEILVYGRPLTRDEEDRVRAYLMAKWGL